MKLILSFCTLFVCFGLILGQKWKCDKSSDRKLDELMSKLLTFGTNRKYPTNKKDMKGYCSENYKLIKSIESFNKQCLDSMSKQALGLIMYSMKSLIDSYCKKNSKYVDYLLSAAPCANTAKKEYNQCHIEFIDALTTSKTNADKKEVVPSICCQYHKIFDCLHSRGKNVKGCSDSILDTSEDFVKAHFSRVFDLLCADFGEQTDKCDKIKRMTIIPPKNSRRRPKSFVIPLIDLLKELEV